MASNHSSNIEDEAFNGNYNFIPVPSVYDDGARFDNRNAEESKQLRAQHEIMAEEERLRVEEMRLRIEEDRVKTERKNALAELRRRELEEEARKIPVVPPKPPTPPPIAAPTPAPAPNTLNPQVLPETFQKPQQGNDSGGLFGAPNKQMNGNNPQQGNNFLPQTQPPPSLQTSGFSNTRQEPPKESFAKPSTPQQPSSGTWQPSSSSKGSPNSRSEGKQNVPFKKMLGDYRRAIRQTCGQLTGERGANKESLMKIMNLLKETLFKVQSPGIDPSNYMASKPNPVEGAMNNGDQLPSLFIYILNFFSKSIVAQFTTEAGVRPETAGPVGIIAVQIFTTPEFMWRGTSLIDILMAKMRVSIPTVFGIRGSEKTEEGRARIGWQKIRRWRLD
ncbi:hypothetical protein DID88_006572 [Monilinia fructigena]|uniref:mRNA export factor GLE1 n=1 Tax=Monilinia fructigena TaxID=38457 RepID=A0A395IMG4_9HELO|nr:hypothetical protein DID88_006572 [Monilinia fructigena]